MEFAEFLRSLGLQPREIRDDARVRRCSTDDKPRARNGAYWLAPGGFTGWAQNHATMTEIARWRADGHVEVPEYNAARMEAELREHRRRQRRTLIAATREARTYYDAASPLRGGHPYLEAHGLDMTGCFGLRVDAKGWLVVPAWRGESLMTVQRIAPDGTKRYWTGASLKGATYPIDRQRATITVLCEGLATGLAIFAAVSLARVVVCFDLGNLMYIAQQPLSGLTVIAADNDHRTVCRECQENGRGTPQDPRSPRPTTCRCNPGLTGAMEAAGLPIGEPFGNASGVAVPSCPDGGTDWCDYRTQRLAERLESWTRRGHETEASIRRAVDAEIAREIQRNAVFRAPEVA